MPETFEKLNIWIDASGLAIDIAKYAPQFPDFQRFGLSSQVLRSSNSIAANIAESQGRYTYQDKIRVLYIARGELFETISHLKIASELGYMDSNYFKVVVTKYYILLHSLNSYIYMLKKKKLTN